MSLKDGLSTLGGKFIASGKTYTAAKVIMTGVPMDITCSFRAGARFGPQKIREVSYRIEEYSVYQDKSLDDSLFFDCGDIDLPIGDAEDCLEIIAICAEEIFNDDKFPLFIGGEHLISVPIIKKAYEKYLNDLVVIQFDAHADLRDGYLGSSFSHASAVRRLIDFMPAKNIYQLGIRSGTKEEFEYAKNNTNLFKYEVLEPLKKILPLIKGKSIYLTIDIDVADPAFANGTGTPEAGGITSVELLQAVQELRGTKLVGFDIVEVAPVYDSSDRTALLAAKIVREIILMVS